MIDQPPETLRTWITQDWRINRGRRDSQLVLAWFRLSQWGLSRWGTAGDIFARVFYAFSSNLLALELWPSTQVGPDLWLPHPHNIHVNANSKIGRNCMIRHGVTIGNATGMDRVETPCPVLGDYVEMGAGAVVIGDIKIGDRVRVGANAVVSSNVPAGAVVVGNPGRVIQAGPPK